MSTVKRSELSNVHMAGGNEEKYTKIILDDHVHNWVGFAWVDEGKATKSDKQKYPTVVD